MKNIIDELVKIHNENFKNKVEDKYFSEMILNEQYKMYCLFNFMEGNIFLENLEKNQEEKINFDKNEKNKKNVLGYIVFYGTIESTDVFEIAIKKEYQGRGFGEMLLTESIKKLIEEEKNLENKNINKNFSENKFLLEVNENNVKALRLYKKIGFKEIFIRKNYYGENENAIIMVTYK